MLQIDRGVLITKRSTSRMLDLKQLKTMTTSAAHAVPDPHHLEGLEHNG